VTDAQIPVQGQKPEPLELDQIPVEERAPEVPEPPASNRIITDILSSNALLSFLAIVLALLIGAILIAFTDPGVQSSLGYFFSRPADTFKAIGEAVGGAYSALFQGSIYNFRRPGFENGIRPLTETLTFATPLIAAGLGVALAFRVGMFNIGGRGQILIAAAAAGWVSWSFELPFFVHAIVATIAAIVGGAIWGGIVGVLKARTGAHEVIVTIMLNYVAFYLVFYALSEQNLLQAPGSANPKSLPMKDSVILPKLFGDRYNLHLGFLLALIAVAVVWWILNRSSLGFRIRAVGENPAAARSAGIDVGRTYIVVMLISGGLVGLAGVNQVLGTVTSGITVDLDASIGFDAITVALLGRATPGGTVLAGILFGALRAGAVRMQAETGVPTEIVQVIQSVIVLFIAAPALIRAIFRLRQSGGGGVGGLAKGWNG
jgi:simple sugar transport system permease protein